LAQQSVGLAGEVGECDDGERVGAEVDARRVAGRDEAVGMFEDSVDSAESVAVLV